MKARIENGIIVMYTQLPSVYKSDTLGLVLGGFDSLDVSIHESEGFYDVVTPKFDKWTQELSQVYFDEVNRVFTYNILTLETPIPKPTKRLSVLTPKEFLSRFTLSEWEAIEGACEVSSAMRFWMKKYDKSQDIDLDDPETIEGMNGMVEFGLITPERLMVIMEIKIIQLEL